MQHADQREQAAGGIEINVDLALQPFLQQFGGFVVDRAPGHIDRFDLLRRGRSDRLIIAVAYREIILDRPPEPAKREDVRLKRRVVGARNCDRQPPFLNTQRNSIGPGIAIGMIAQRLEIIAFDQIENGNAAFLLNVGAAPQNRMLVERDVDDPGIGHASAYRANARANQRPSVDALIHRIIDRRALIARRAAQKRARMATLPAQPAPIGPVPRSLPQNVEAEAALLGAMMIDERIADDIADRLSEDHFFEPVHGRVFAAIKRIRKDGMKASPVTLRPLFAEDLGMRALGGPAYLAQLTGSGAGLIGARDFATQIYDLAMLRTLVAVGRDMVERATDTSEEVNPRKQIDMAEEALFKVAADNTSENTVKSFGQAATLAIGMAERAQNAGGNLSGITTGLDSINAKTGGMHKSDLMILAGRPGMGKTSLATNIAFNAAQRYMRDITDGIAPDRSVGTKVAFFSLEMSADQLATRILAEQ